MTYFKIFAAVLMAAAFGLASACPDQPGSQSKSTKAEKPLAPKPTST